MRHDNRGFRFFGLVFLAALSLMAFGAVALRAALPGESTPGEFELAEPAISDADFLAKPEGTAELSVPTIGIKIKCTGGHAEGNFVSAKEALATVKYTGCKVFDTGGNELPCHILNGAEKDVIIATATFLPVLHGGELFALAEPDSPATNFTQIVYEGGKGCPVPLKPSVTGSVTAQSPSGAEVEPLITFSEAIQKLTGDKLLYGTFEAFLNASAIVKLTGFHEGYAFSVV